MGDSESPAGEQQSLEVVRQRAYELLLEEATAAAKGKDQERFDALISKLVFDDVSLEDSEPAAHERRMDRWRVLTTAAMVAALVLIIVAAIFHKQTTGRQAATGFVSLFSGLAGIALGWLFGTGGARVERRAPRAPRSRQAKPPPE
jgi:hypothetical protein